MSIKPLLFSGVREASVKKRDLTLFDHLKQVMDRRAGIEVVFRLAINAFSWAKLAPVEELLKTRFNQAHCIAVLSQSAFQLLRAPMLLTQAFALWCRGKSLKRSVVDLKDHVSTNPVEFISVRKVGTVAKEALGWVAGAINWTCRTLEVANEALGSVLSKKVTEVVSKLESLTGMIVFGFFTFNIAHDLAEHAALSDGENGHLRKIRKITRRSLFCSTMSSASIFISSLAKGLRVFSVFVMPQVCSLTISTVGLLFRIRAIYLQNKCRLDTARVNVPV